MRWLTVLLLFGAVGAHVRLTFPPAREPSLDYFSSARNEGPCGVVKPPMGKGVRTFLQSGSVLEVEWFTAIPHQGGIKLEVLNAKDEPIAVFHDFTDSYNATQNSKAVELPVGFECPDCAIRITHQATEYSADYTFFSCADISILKTLPNGDSCLGGGKRVSGICQCPQGTTGSQCQYKEECRNNDDCGAQGLCSAGDSSEHSQCFCPNGRYGTNCQKESTTMRTLSDFNEALYNMREAQDNKIYWRIIRDEIEMVLRFPGLSWIAVGWKPKDFVCEPYIPNRSTAAATIATTTVGKVAHATTRTPIEIIGNSVRNETLDQGDECSPNEQWSECPESSRECEASCDWTKFPETTPNCPRQCGTPRCICKEGYVRMNNDEEVCVPFEFCDKESGPSCPTNSTWAKCGIACEPTCANMYDPAPCPASCAESACTCADNYVRYNGNCIYWGDCPELENHRHDVEESVNVAPTVNAASVSAVAPTSTKPLKTTKTIVPSACAVNETITECGRACEADCETIFTRGECDLCDQPACACLQGYARGPDGNCMYWGDCPPSGSATDAPQPTTKISTPKKSLKPKVDGDVCYGDFRYPPGCTDCDYKISWNLVDETDEIEFSLETRLTGNVWTGVGFSSDGTMTDADMLIVKSFNGKLSVHDMTSEGYGAPIEDQHNDVTFPEIVGTHDNGVLRVQFIRKRNTGDGVDKQFDSECWKMMFPVTGGQLDSNGNVTVHDSKPLISDRQVCIRSCHDHGSISTSRKCISEYRYPENCRGEECEYTASWKYNSKEKDIRFEISSKNMGRWTGIGLSKDGQMANSDVYTGWVYEGRAYVTDRFAYGRQLPAIDPADRQDIYNIGGKMDDETQTIWFHRKVTTKDRLTDYSLDKCYFFLFPIGGGRVIAKKSSDFTNPRTPIGYHDLYQPRVSAQKICICDEHGVSIAKEEPSRVRSRRQVLQGAPKKSNAMECTDMVVASVVDGRGRVKDFYSPSKASPRPDSFFGGDDSLTSTAAFQENGITTVVFRKKLRSTDKYDHPINRGPMTLIWAKGADPANYQHTTGGPAIKVEQAFFPNGLFKYHGKNQRGHMIIDFYDDKKLEPTVHGMHLDVSTCTGAYSQPDDCQGNSCTYTMKWTSDGSVARFILKTSLNNGEWTALGFSPEGTMAESDVIVMGVHDGTVTVTDQFMPNYGRPVIDEQQDIFDVETSFINGVLTASFSRELFSNDAKDVNLQKCMYILYTPTPGLLEKTGEIQKHTSTPVRSPTKICLNTCSQMLEKPFPQPTSPSGETEDSIATISTTEQSKTITTESEIPDETTQIKIIKIDKNVEKESPKTTVGLPPVKINRPVTIYEPEEAAKARYGLRIRILNREYVPDLADPQTEYYQSFTKEVSGAINKLLSKRFNGIKLSKIIAYSKGSVIADIEVVSTNDVPRPIEIKSWVEENAVRGSVNGLAIEPSTVKTYDIEANPIAEAGITDTYKIAIIAGAVALFALSLLVFICCCYCCRRETRYNSYPLQHPASYPYGTVNMKKSGFDNAAYHGRHYSQQTTSTKPGQPSPPQDHHEEAPEGIGETTYQEWYSKVGSKVASQEHEEAPPASVRPPSAQPYVSYPNDPSGYYTLGGEHRTPSAQPKYFRY